MVESSGSTKSTVAAAPGGEGERREAEWREHRRLPGMFRSWWLLERAALRTQGQFRQNFVVGLIGGVVFQGIQVAFLAILLNQFNLIGGWGWREIGLIFGIRLSAHALYVMPFGTIPWTERLVRTGEFDLFQLRPVNTFIQVITRRFSVMSVGDGLIGLTALVGFALQAPVFWTPGKMLFLAVSILSGGLVETAFQTAIASLAFVLTATTGLNLFADNTITSFGGYPLTIFGRVGVWLLTFILPMAFIAYLPATMLLDRTDEVPLPLWLVHLSPAVGVGLFALSLALFTRMSRRYVSPSVG